MATIREKEEIFILVSNVKRTVDRVKYHVEFLHCHIFAGRTKMKRLRTISIIILCITLVMFVLWRFVVPFPDWLIRVNGVIMTVSIFTAVFSAMRIVMGGK